MMPDSPKAGSRRRWLLRALNTTIVATGAVIFYPVLRFLQPRATTDTGAMEKVAPYRVNELKPDAEGRWPPPFNFGGKPCLIIRTPGGAVRAFNAICTHLDCTVTYHPDKPEIFCPCHAGQFDLKGRVVAGPPPEPLQEYKVTLQGKSGQEQIIVSRTG